MGLQLCHGDRAIVGGIVGAVTGGRAVRADRPVGGWPEGQSPPDHLSSALNGMQAAVNRTPVQTILKFTDLMTRSSFVTVAQ